MPSYSRKNEMLLLTAHTGWSIQLSIDVQSSKNWSLSEDYF